MLLMINIFYNNILLCHNCYSSYIIILYHTFRTMLVCLVSLLHIFFTNNINNYLALSYSLLHNKFNLPSIKWVRGAMDMECEEF